MSKKKERQDNNMVKKKILDLKRGGKVTRKGASEDASRNIK